MRIGAGRVGRQRRRTYGLIAVVVAALVACLTDPGPAQAATIPTPPAACHPTHTPGLPVMTSFTFTPDTFDVTTAGKKITFTIHATDSTKNISAMDVVFQSPNIGGVVRDGQANMSLTDGTGMDGTWTGSATIPRWTNNGMWHISEVAMSDAGGGFMFYFPPASPWDPGWPYQFDVSSTPDVKAPTVSSVTLSPGSVNTSKKTQRITATVKVKDDHSGLPIKTGVYATGFVTIGPRFFSISGENLKRIAGTAKNGTYKGGFNVPMWVQSGKHVWQLTLDLVDAAGNEADLDGAALKAQHHTSSFAVTSRTDNTLPVLRSLSFKPASVDARNGHKNVVVTAQVSDTLSGLEGVSVTFTSPSGASSSAFASAPTNGPVVQTMKLTLPIPRCSEPGIWTVSADVYDNAGNTKHYTTAQVKAKHSPTTLQVKALDVQSPRGSIPKTISPTASLTATFTEPTLWKDGTAQTALQVLDSMTFDPVDGTWSCKNAAGSSVTCDANGANVKTASFTPTMGWQPSHAYTLQTTQPDIFDTSGNQLPTWVQGFMTAKELSAG